MRSLKRHKFLFSILSHNYQRLILMADFNVIGNKLMAKDKTIESDENPDRRLKYCQRAPEWAEHARFDAEDEPCDDGRTGIVCGNRKGEKPCPI